MLMIKNEYLMEKEIVVYVTEQATLYEMEAIPVHSL